jgi:hypothetical protein
MVSNEVEELGLVFGGKVGQPLDMLLVAGILVATIPLASEEHHTDPGQA